MNLIEANRERDLWLTDGTNCVFIPREWCDNFTVAKGFAGGPDWKDGQTGEPLPELYGYGPVQRSPLLESNTFLCVTRLRDDDGNHRGSSA